jgi:hypothetical protein
MHTLRMPKKTYLFGFIYASAIVTVVLAWAIDLLKARP